MQLFFDLLPVIAFFAAYKFFDVFVATGTLMAAMVLQVTVHWVRFRKVSNLTLISAAMALVFGGLTLMKRDPIFLQWKLSIVEWLFSAAFLVSRFVGQRRTLLELLLGEAMTLERATWDMLNWQFVVLFGAIGAVNLYLMFHVSFDTWVYFRTGSALLPILLMVGQFYWLVKQGKVTFAEEAPSPEGK
jgi:intracellular septation protein